MKKHETVPSGWQKHVFGKRNGTARLLTRAYQSSLPPARAGHGKVEARRALLRKTAGLPRLREAAWNKTTADGRWFVALTFGAEVHSGRITVCLPYLSSAGASLERPIAVYTLGRVRRADIDCSLQRLAGACLARDKKTDPPP